MSVISDLESWKIFFDIIYKGSVSKVAEDLGVEVSSVSRRLSRLESELGVQLFKREGKRLVLSSVGSLAFSRMRRIVFEADETFKDLKQGSENTTRAIRIAAPVGLSQIILPEIISSFLVAFPDSKISVTALSLADLFKKDTLEHYDIIFSTTPIPHPLGRTKFIGGFQHFIGATPSYLKIFPPIREPRELLSHKLICFYPQGSEHLQVLHRGEEMFQLPLHPALKTNHPGGVKTAVMKGIGVGIFLPTYFFAEELRLGQIVPLLSDWQMPLRHSYLTTRETITNSLLQNFIDYTIESLSRYTSLTPPGGKGYWIGKPTYGR